MIETQGLTHRFGDQAGISNVDLHLPEGAAMALVGANGAGKTTLLRLLLNILQPSSGNARVLGRDSRSLGHRDFQRIGYASESQVLPARLTVSDLFDYLRPLYDHWDRDLEGQFRRQFELPADRRVDLLSNGAGMKLKLAAALSFRPRLLILDEPLGGLDQDMRDQVLDGLIDRAGDTTILMATHEVAEIERFATHIAFLAQGRLLFQSESAALTARMREVRIQLHTLDAALPQLPESWLDPSLAGRTLSFTDSGFISETVLKDQLEQAGLTVDRIDMRPLSLREITATLMRTRHGGGMP